MSKAVFEKNIEAMKVHLPGLADTLKKEWDENSGEFHIEVETALDGNKIFILEKEGKRQYLNGKYAPGKCVDEWYTKIKKVSYMSFITMFGVGSGLYLRKVIEETEDTVNIIVYEPSKEIFKMLLQEIDISDLLTQRAIGFVIEGINGDELKDIIDKILGYDNLSLYHNLIHPGYSKFFAEEAVAYAKKIQKRIRDLTVARNTRLRFLQTISKNCLRNCCYIPYHYKARQLPTVIPTDIPAIVVSAGPSLNKNIKQLKKAKGKAFIIAVDTAIKPLMKQGIEPDVFVIVDGLKPVQLIEADGISNVPIVTPVSAASEVLEYHKGKKFFFADGYAYADKLYAIGGTGLQGLETGGSVANNAFSLAYLMGFKTIILVGQDLALTNGRSHANGTFKDKMEQLDLNNPAYIEVEGIDGEPIKTRPDFNMYLKWFENVIKERSYLDVIDATEGGALIHGTRVMKLKDAIKEQCKKEVNIQELLAKIPPLFNKQQRKKMERYMMNSPKKILEVQKKARQGIRLYNRLEKVCKKKVFSNEEYIDVCKKIGVITSYMEKEPLAAIILESLKAVDYMLLEGIYETEDTVQKEGLSVAKQGRYMMQCIEYAVDEMQVLLQQTVGSIVDNREQFQEIQEKDNS